MPSVQDEKASIHPLNTSVQIQQIFSEVQSQLPSVDLETNDQNDDNEDSSSSKEIFESNIAEDTDALLESLSNNDANSFLTMHSKDETTQQPPSVDLQMRASPNIFDNPSQNQESSLKLSILSMDLFNSIDFEKLSSLNPNHSVPQCPNLTRTFHRPRPINPPHLSSQQQTNVRNRDDRHILELLSQQANKYTNDARSHSKRGQHPLKNLKSALRETSSEHIDRHGRTIKLPELERNTIYIDLRNANIPNKEKIHSESQSINVVNSTSQQIQLSESESDDESDCEMLWFEKRQKAKQQQLLNSLKQ